MPYFIKDGDSCTTFNILVQIVQPEAVSTNTEDIQKYYHWCYVNKCKSHYPRRTLIAEEEIESNILISQDHIPRES